MLTKLYLSIRTDETRSQNDNIVVSMPLVTPERKILILPVKNHFAIPMGMG
jgi:hypothetical protein